MTDVELSMLQYGSCINSAKSVAEIGGAIERRRAEQVALERDAHATKDAMVEIIRKMYEAAESNRIALEVAQKSLKLNNMTFWVSIVTFVASIVSKVVAIAKG